MTNLQQLLRFVNAEIHHLEKYWEGYNPETALIPHPHFEYDQGMLKAYRIILAEMTRDQTSRQIVEGYKK